MKLIWLPQSDDWKDQLTQVRTLSTQAALPKLVHLANHSLDFLQTSLLDRVLDQFAELAPQHLTRTSPIKFAVLGSSTLTHLIPGIRVAALRRGFWIDIFEGQYGMYRQELADPSSDLYAFKPDVVLLALDAHHLTSGDTASVEDALRTITSCWELAKDRLGASLIQQTILPVFPPLLGNNEHQYDRSSYSVVQGINQGLRKLSAEHGVHLLAVDALAQQDGVANWYEPALWHRSKQEVHPRVSHLFGDHVGRTLAAIRGLSYKCMVLDLDNTLWGGVIGDDGLEGIMLGQGHAVGEAYVSFQRYAKALAARGVILAVCSKNEFSIASSAFDQHPEMVLRTGDIACFVANWEDKASNLRHIAKSLNIGLDSLVFVDDNPFERNLVRQELPMVAVPELPEDPALYEVTLAAAGYFEALGITEEDRERTRLYAANADRERIKDAATDMAGYLRSLNMRLVWATFDLMGLSRITQLVNKSNQFNLATRRYSQDELGAMIGDPKILALQLRLTDTFGDNGMIAVVIGRRTSPSILDLDTWLMSCRVLGRQVEEATLNLIVQRAREAGVSIVTGSYLPTPKNGIVRSHYERLGFRRISPSHEAVSHWCLEIGSYAPRETFVELIEAVEVMEPNSQELEGRSDGRTNLFSTY